MISPDAERRMRAALAKLQADAERAEQAAPGLLGRWWADVMDAESSATGAAELARQARKDATRFEERLATLLASPYSTDADAARYVREAGDSFGGGAGAGAIVEETAALLTPTAAVVETAKGTAADLAAAAKKGLGFAPLVLGLVVVLVVLARGWRSS